MYANPRYTSKGTQVTGTGSVHSRDILTAPKATLYFINDWGMKITREVKDLEIEVKPYAQFPHALAVTFVDRGKRKRRGFWQTSYPSLVVLKGWGHPEYDMFVTTRSMPGMTVRESKGDTLHSDEAMSDFNNFIDDLKGEVLADYRGHNPR